MKMITVKSKKSTIVKKAIAGILTSSLALFSVVPAYAAVPDTQSSGSSSWYVPWQNTSHSIYSGESIGDILRYFAQWNDIGLSALYQRLGGLSADIQAVEGAINNIPGAIDYSTILNSIESKIVDYTNNFASVDSKLQSIVNNLVNVNTGLTNIKTDTGNIKSNTDSIKSYTNTANTYLNNINNKLAILDDNYTPQSLISIIRRRYTASNMFPSAEPYTTNFNPLNVTYITSNADNQYTIDSVGTGAKRSIYTMLGYTNTNIVSLFSALQTIGTTYRVQKLDYADGNPEFDDEGNGWNYTYSIADQLHFMNVNMASFFSRMGFVLADDDTISAKNANKTQEQAALTNFTGSGSASASASDFGQLSNAVGSVKSGLNTNASPADVLTVFNSTDGFGWFSQATLDALDTTSNSTRLMKAGSDTPLYDSNYNAIMEYLTGGDRK